MSSSERVGEVAWVMVLPRNASSQADWHVRSILDDEEPYDKKQEWDEERFTYGPPGWVPEGNNSL